MGETVSNYHQPSPNGTTGRDQIRYIKPEVETGATTSIVLILSSFL